MTFVTIPNRPAGTDQRSIEAILADFDAITNVINGQLDNTNLSATAGIKGTQIDPGAGIQDVYQNGVLLPSDLAISAISIATGTGAITFTLAAASGVWVKNTSGILVRQSPGQRAGQVLSPPSLPASGQYAVYGLETDSATGVLSLVKGADTATQLNTGTLIAANSPATTNGKMRVYDFALWNNAGTINFSDHTVVATAGVNYIDRRPWARGAKATASATNWGSTAQGAILWGPVRMECTGAYVKFTGPSIEAQETSPPSVVLNWQFWMDGVSQGNAGVVVIDLTSGQNQKIPTTLSYSLTPVAGSHLFQVVFNLSGGTGQSNVGTSGNSGFLEEKLGTVSNINGTA